MIRDLIAAILVAILIDVSWNAAGMRDPLPEPSRTTTFAAPIMPGPSGAVLREGPASAVSDTADAIHRGSKANAVGAVAQSGAGTTMWWYPRSDPNKQHCFTFDSAGNIVDAGGVCP